ncbi:hypothetical protein F2Q70_00031345 [Brassica cretica]|uniref:Retrotransposon gag domain-containing protein n=1 Tax=Brassica cretica TaxID=69181 RepID=A0A8S9FD73_BRACR|nr:hypothetical protein F2Q70_00031345 [Brassica cretica]
MIFNNTTAPLQATGKAPMDPCPSHPATPNNSTPHQPPDPPDLTGYNEVYDHNIPHNTKPWRQMGFPAFDGTQLQDGISKCEQFFDIDGTSPDLKVRLAALHFTGKASEWNHNFMSTRMRIILPEGHALSIFLANMNTHLSLHTRQFEVITIASAAKITMLHESSLSHTHSKPFRASFNPTQNQKPYQKHPPSTPLLQTNDAPKPTQPGFIPRNVSAPCKYSYQEMQDRRSKGLCMFCEEPFTSGHQLKHKRSKIFFMECDDDNNSSDGDNEEVVGVITGKDDEPDITPVLSINAING